MKVKFNLALAYIAKAAGEKISDDLESYDSCKVRWYSPEVFNQAK